MAADSITATEIDVTNLAAISADMGTITAGSITAGSVAATTLNLNGTTLSADANGLTLNVFDAFTHINADTVGITGGVAGQDVSMISWEESSQTNFVNTAPQHIAASGVTDALTSSTNVFVPAGTVMGGYSGVAGVPLFSTNFTTGNFSGTKSFIVQVTVDPVGSYGSSSSSGFAYAMRATNSSTAYTSTNANDYVSTRGTSKGGRTSNTIYQLSDIVSLTGNQQYYIWVFGTLDDVGTSGGVRGIRDGAITVTGLNV